METRNTTLIIGGLLALTLLLGGGLALVATRPAQAQTAAVPGALTRHITVVGSGETRLRPDIATIQLGVETRAATTSEALTQNSTQMTALIDKLKALSIAETDIQTSNFNINAEYNSDNQQITGYIVGNTVSVTIRNLDQAGTLIDQVVAVGANRVYGIGFSVADPAAAMTQARDAAVANARAKAEQMAKTSGATLGQVLQISEQITGAPPMPLMMAERADAANTPVMAGEQGIMAQVQITYELR